MDKFRLIGGIYSNALKPVLFTIDPEVVHLGFTKVGEAIGNRHWALGITDNLFAYKNPNLKKTVLGVEFPNPVGLAAGFDWDGHLAAVMRPVGFGFNTVGTVTARAYEGNAKPRLGRLPKSRSLFVNKGFMSEGAGAVAERLDNKILDNKIIGISVGSSNVPEVNTINRAIDDYLFTFNTFRDKKYVSYFELNISCPNTAMTESFGDLRHFRSLVSAVKSLHLKQPVFVKMANEITPAFSFELIAVSIKNNIRGFIFSNLVKDRNNSGLDKEELANFNNLKGNFSGKPTEENANKLIKSARKKFGRNIAIIGCGGIFNAQDAKAKFEAGADLVQLVTGMIFRGPQLAGEINSELIK